MGIRSTIINWLGGNKTFLNTFNEAFLWGGEYTAYDKNNVTYIEKGYNINPMVYSIVNQMSQKTASVPIYVRKIEDKNNYKRLKQLRSATKRKYTIQQKVKESILETKAFKSDYKDFPMEQPNPNQSWPEFIALYKTFLKLTGNCYIYLLKVEEGREAGKPLAVYILPSHLMQIVLKKKADLLGIDDPVDGYMLTEGRSYIEFKAEDVIHIKYSNPNYGMNGEHLYGMSPLRAALLNIQSSNLGLDLGIKTLNSGGAFGFIHGKSTPLTAEQATEIKSRLIEMNSSTEALGKIGGVSAELGFTRLSLTSDELKPFDYLKFDQKQICNVLAWSDSLLNNDDGGKYDKQDQERKRVITDNIVPDLELFVSALNNKFLPLFKGYEDSVLEFDVMELPEMQDDAIEESTWLYNGLDRGVFNRNEIRTALRWEEATEAEMDVYTVAADVITLKESIDNDFSSDNGNE